MHASFQRGEGRTISSRTENTVETQDDGHQYRTHEQNEGRSNGFLLSGGIDGQLTQILFNEHKKQT